MPVKELLVIALLIGGACCIPMIRSICEMHQQFADDVAWQTKGLYLQSRGMEQMPDGTLHYTGSRETELDEVTQE